MYKNPQKNFPIVYRIFSAFNPKSFAIFIKHLSTEVPSTKPLKIHITLESKLTLDQQSWSFQEKPVFVTKTSIDNTADSCEVHLNCFTQIKTVSEAQKSAPSSLSHLPGVPSQKLSFTFIWLWLVRYPSCSLFPSVHVLGEFDRNN